jgi:hypothetical protein
VTTLLSVLSSLLAGILLAVVPWTAFWETNYFLHPHPVLRQLMLSAFTRGAVTGLGLVNIMIALYEAHHYLADSREP